MLPLIRLTNLQPFVRQAKKRGADTDALLRSFFLHPNAINDPSIFVHAMVLYQIVESLAPLTGDNKFCGKVSIELFDNPWEQLEKAAQYANSLGDFITILINDMHSHSTASEITLTVSENSALIVQRRLMRIKTPLSQNDAASLSMWYSILMKSLASNWNPEKVKIAVAEPRALPEPMLRSQINRSEPQQFQVEFPVDWLSILLPKRIRGNTSNIDRLNSVKNPDLVPSMQLLVKPHIGEQWLTAYTLGKLFNTSKRTLERQFEYEGLSLGAVIDDLRIEEAKNKLQDSSKNISDVTNELGFSSPSNFSRSFRRNTGLSPGEFIKSLNY